MTSRFVWVKSTVKRRSVHANRARSEIGNALGSFKSLRSCLCLLTAGSMSSCPVTLGGLSKWRFGLPSGPVYHRVVGSDVDRSLEF